MLLLGQKEFSAEGRMAKAVCAKCTSRLLVGEMGQKLVAMRGSVENLVSGEKMGSERERKYIIP